MERRGALKLTGPRALAAEGALFVAGVVAACNPTPSAETPNPTILPTESPIPTLIVVPSETPSPTVTTTPEITPAPTPEATPIAIGDLVTQITADAKQNGWPTVSKEELKNSIDLAYESDPEAASIINTNENILERDYVNKAWEICSTSKDLETVKAVCATLSNQLYWKGFRINQNDSWIPAFSNVIYFAHSSLNADDFGGFIYRISESINPF